MKARRVDEDGKTMTEWLALTQIASRVAHSPVAGRDESLYELLDKAEGEDEQAQLMTDCTEPTGYSRRVSAWRPIYHLANQNTAGDKGIDGIAKV